MWAWKYSWICILISVRDCRNPKPIALSLSEKKNITYLHIIWFHIIFKYTIIILSNLYDLCRHQFLFIKSMHFKFLFNQIYLLPSITTQRSKQQLMHFACCCNKLSKAWSMFISVSPTNLLEFKLVHVWGWSANTPCQMLLQTILLYFSTMSPRRAKSVIPQRLLKKNQGDACSVISLLCLHHVLLRRQWMSMELWHTESKPNSWKFKRS